MCVCARMQTCMHACLFAWVRLCYVCVRVWSCVCVEVQPLSAVCLQSVEPCQPLWSLLLLCSLSPSTPPLCLILISGPASHLHFLPLSCNVSEEIHWFFVLTYWLIKCVTVHEHSWLKAVTSTPWHYRALLQHQTGLQLALAERNIGVHQWFISVRSWRPHKGW